jgi:competence protein ComEC
MFFLWKREKRVFSVILKTAFCLVSLYFFFLFTYLKIPMITVFDVGKGDAILIKLPSRASSYYVLWDTGPNFGEKHGFNWTKFYLVPVIKKLGVNSFDLVVISHPDLDHSGGYATFKKYFSVEEAITSEFPEACWKKVNLKEPLPFLTDPEIKKLGGAELFLYPGKKEHLLNFQDPCKHLNSESLVGILEYKGFTMILPGDIDVKRFSSLIYNGSVFPAEVLLSPHHGSKSGLSSFILKAVKPKTVLISGRGRFHPHPLILKLLKREKIPYFITSSSGAIYVFPRKSSFLICEEKKRRKDFWAGLLFPLVPYYLDTMGCYRFDYHSEKGV